jgi:hypothetical protein
LFCDSSNCEETSWTSIADGTMFVVLGTLGSFVVAS